MRSPEPGPTSSDRSSRPRGRLRFRIGLASGLLVLFGTLLAPPVLVARRRPHPAFDRLKALAGSWTGATSGRRKVNEFSAFHSVEDCSQDWNSNGDRATYEVISAGTALMERLFIGTPMEMVTIYHPDGEDMMATHYCAGESQPRLRTRVPVGGDSRVFVFHMHDATNILHAAQMHIERLTITFHDDDHFSQTWETHTDVTHIEFTRDRPGASPPEATPAPPAGGTASAAPDRE